MFQSNIDFEHMACQERCKELLREADHERLIQVAGLRQSDHWAMQRKLVGWIGVQMVKWGYKLQLL